MTYILPSISVQADGNQEVLTLRENGKVLETRRVPTVWTQWPGRGTVAMAPSTAAQKMLEESPVFGPAYTVCFEGRGFSIHLKSSR